MEKRTQTILIAIALLLTTAVVLFFVSQTQAPTEPIVIDEAPTEDNRPEQPSEPSEEPEVIEPTSYKDLIRVDSPVSNSVIQSPVSISGQARGNWFFEASFPVQVVDGNGTVIGNGIAQADGEWMTTEYVPFMVSVTFSTPTTDSGEIVLEKQNASGLPENADEFRIPIRFNN